MAFASSQCGLADNRSISGATAAVLGIVEAFTSGCPLREHGLVNAVVGLGELVGAAVPYDTRECGCFFTSGATMGVIVLSRHWRIAFGHLRRNGRATKANLVAGNRRIIWSGDGAR